ncbi:MAG: type 2 isopentenyl-diphosphate Delta-isomerase [Firmicutes bacterium]|nr:type 2 isopentenyl-diphosphate Delta-isomerase [Alicyclobacillaceae bacterium]MCL6496042.1 type 2 isopentenyl-diphosphate Delta-isomerase [Bacillota bacterium]
MPDSEEVLRQLRKAEHLAAVRGLGDRGPSPGFEDVALVPNCAPEVDWTEVSLETTLCGIRLPSPLIINAMTGGHPEAEAINRRLARVARRFGLAMAVGSQRAALGDPSVAPTYAVARREYPEGVLIANLGLNASVAEARAAIALIGAQILQIHWNVAQELFMAEGDRQFRGAMDALASICAEVPQPVIAKEVGQGIAGPEAWRFVQAGVRAIDVGGAGGTNFLAVEAWRRGESLDPEWERWGLPTVVTLSEVLATVDGAVDVIASGGVRTAHDVVKAMALGATAVGMAGPLLRLVSEPDGEARAEQFLAALHRDLQTLLVLTGSRNWQALRQRPVVVRGDTAAWLDARGFGAWRLRLARRHPPGA